MKRTEPCRHERHTTARNVTAFVWTNKRMGGQRYMGGEDLAREHLGEKAKPQHFSKITFCSNPSCERVKYYEVSRG